MDYLQTFDDKRAISGYKAQLLFKLSDEDKYHLLIPLETVPSVFGSVDTFEYDLLTSDSKGKVEGKESLDQVDVEFLLTRDFVLRLQELEGEAIDFLCAYNNGLGYTFTGTLKVRANEAAADVLKGTFTITPISANPNIITDVRSMIRKTVRFIDAVPDHLAITTSETKVYIVTEPTTAELATTVTPSSQETNYTVETIQEGNKRGISIKKTENAAQSTDTNAVIEIKATMDDDTYASWTTTIAVE